MKTCSLSVRTLLLILIQVVIITSQSIREGRCPAKQKRRDCPDAVWDTCTCDLDCQGIQKCCFDGCNYECLDPDFGIPSVRNNADVVFIMDSSGSIGKPDYKREKQFVKDLTNVFEISPNATRVSTIIYSDYPKLIFDFDTYSDKQSINTAHDNLEYLGNKTRIDKALNLTLSVFSRSRPSVPRIAFVLTDGEQTDENDAKPLDVAVRPLHDLGVQVYVIGIGSYIKREELYLMARRQQDVFFVSSFENLLRQTYRIVNQIDTVQDLIPPLQIKADILFLVDSSSAISRLNYPHELEFLKKVVGQFRISPRYVRAGVIPYGSRAELSIPFGRHSTNEAMNRSIELLPYIGGQKRMEKALMLANQTFSEARPLVPKILLILTYGGDLTVPGANVLTPTEALRAQGVSMFVISIGQKVDYARLDQMVPRSFLITDKTHRSLEPYLQFAASYVRMKSDFRTPPQRNAAVVFLIDSSVDSVDKDNFKRQREFIISLAKSFKIPENGARVSVITYGRDARPIVQFKDSGDFNSFLHGMMRSSRMQGPRRMDEAFIVAVRMFKDHVKPGPRAVVLLTSGPQAMNSWSALEDPIRKLEKLGARIFVVSIGSNVSYSQIRRLVNSSNDIFQIPSFLRLQSEIHAIGRHISLTPGARPRFIADIVFLMDSALDVGNDNYRRQKEFVKVIAKALNLGKDASRACLVVYNERARLVTTFNTHRTLKEFENALLRARHMSHGRRIDKALVYAADLLTRARREIPKVVVLITSGRRSSSNSLDVASNPLKTGGAKSFVVAIGNTPDIRELRLVVSKNDDVFEVPSFILLSRIEESFPKHIISSFVSPEEPETEPDDVDVIFLIDSSEDVSSQTFRRVKSFIKSMAENFNISPGKSRAALVTYGLSPSVEYPFGDTRFDDSVDGAKFIGGGRRVDLAMQEAARLLLSARQSVPKPVVLLTAGNQGPGSPSPEITSAMVRNRGGRPFVFMIGREPDQKEFVKMVEKSDHVFKIPSFEVMNRYAASLVKRIYFYLKKEPKLKPNYVAEIVFVLDSSSGVPVTGYKKQKDFVKLLARDLDVSPGRSNAALVVFGNMAMEVLSFDSNRSLSNFEKAVDNSPYLKGNRRIDRALNETVKIMAKARPSSTKVVILLTAGNQSSDSGIQSPGEAALPLLKSGAYIYVVAIGRETNITQLRPVVQEWSHIFRMASYDDLRRRETSLAYVVIDTSSSPKPITNIEADVIFIMDSSFDVSQEDFIRQKRFVKDMARYLRVSAAGSRAAVVTYGKNSSLLFKFDSYGTLSSFDKSVDNAPFIGGRRRMDLALIDAGLLLSEARPDNAKWVILLTAGRHPTGPDIKSLDEASKPVLERSDKVYVVAIGKEANIRQLQDVVVDPKDIFAVSSSGNLKSQRKLIANAIVEGHNNRVVKAFKADVVFLVDTSSSVGTLNFRSQKQFVKSMARSLNVEPGKSRAAIVTYGTTSDASEMQTRLSAFERAVDASRFIRGERRMHLAVNDASSLLQAARPDVHKIVFLLSGGRESTPDVTLFRQSLRTLRASGAKIYVILIGADHSMDDFHPAVERLEDIFTVSSFDNLVSLARKMSETITKRADPLVPRFFQADVLFIMDSSGDVSRQDYMKEKDFIVTLAKYLHLSPNQTRAALLTYGYTPRIIASYDTYDRLVAFRNATESAPYISGQRRIDRAMSSASQLISGARKLLPNIIILLVGGNQAIPYSIGSETKKKLHNRGARVFVVAIGDGTSINELRLITQRKDVFQLSSFEDLRPNIPRIAHELGKQPDQKIPDSFVGGSIVFLVDSSIDVSSFNFERAKEFLKGLTDAFNSPSSNVHSALINYGDRAQLVYNLNNEMNTTALHRAIDSAEAVGGGRRIERALEVALRLIRNSEQPAPNVMLLITAGPFIQGEGAQPLSFYGSALESIGTNSFVLAIGDKARTRELTPLVKASEDVLSVKNFESLRSIIGRLAFYIAQRTLNNTVPGLDVVFVMDSSSDVTASNYLKQKEAVKSMARSLNVPSGESRASVITYGSRARLVMTFNGYSTFSALENAIDLAPNIDGRRRIDSALVDAGNVLSAARPSHRKMVVLFTSGRTDPSSRDLYISARRIFAQDAELFIFAIGERPYPPELAEVVSKPGRVVNVSSFANLQTESKEAIRSVVRSLGPKTYDDFAADLIILVDTSSGVDRKFFDRQKAFVKSLVKSLDFSLEKSRVAVISYGSTTSIGRFSSSQDKDKIASDVDNLQYKSGGRNITKALEEASSLFNTARESVSKVLVLLTTGSEPSLAAPSQILRNRGTNVFVIAVGDAVDTEELTPIVDEPRDIFSLAIPQELTWKSDYMIDEIIKRARNFKADIVFLVDSSLGVTDNNFNVEKLFITRLSEVLNLSPRNSRVAVVLYALYPRLAVRLGILQTPESLSSILDGLTRIEGNRRMDNALEYASKLFDDSRPGVRKIVVMLTAGPQSAGGKPLLKAVEPLGTIGARIYVIAVGNQVNVTELTSVVNRKEDIQRVRSFQRLISNVKPIGDYIMNANVTVTPGVTSTATATTTTTTTTPTPSPTPTPKVGGLAFASDVVFVVDSSSEVGVQNYKREKDFIKLMAKHLNLNPEKSRVSVVIYSSVARTDIKFGDYSNATTFDKAIEGLHYFESGRKMDLGLREAAAVLKNARDGVPKVVILLTTGRQSLPTSPLVKAVKPLVKLKAKLFIVAITSRIYERELLPLVDHPDDLRKVPSFQSLTSQSWPIANYIANNTDIKLVNIIFLVDSSSVITPDGLVKEKGFVKALVRAFQVPILNSRMAILLYGSVPMPSKRLIVYKSFNDFDNDVDSLKAVSGDRRMDLALKTAENLLQREKSRTRNIVILLTTGRQASGYRDEQLADSGKAARGVGAEVFVVAIGSEQNLEELRSVVSDFQNIYQVGSLDYLQREALPIGRDIIGEKVRPSDITADIVFMMDSSSSVSKENYEKEKEFIKYLARHVNITSEKSRMAVIVYSGTSMFAVRFDGYSSFDEFDYSVDEIPLIGGPYRRMDLALQSAGRVFNSARKNVSKIAVLLTAGRQVPGGSSLTSSYKQLQSFQADTLVVAIGKQYNEEELSTVVSLPKDIIKVPSFDALAFHAKNLGEAIEDKAAPKPEDIVADIIFLLDSSSSISSINFQIAKKFVKALARSLNVASNKSKGSVIVYGSAQDVAISLEEFTDLADFKLAVDVANYMGGLRRMDLALQAAARIMRSARRNIPKIAILITAGRQTPPNTSVLLKNAVRPLRGLGAQTFVVAIGSDPEKREIDTVVEDPRNVFNVSSFVDLLPKAAEIARPVANRSKEQPMDVDADIVFLVDSSGFVTQRNFLKEKQFVKSLAKFLNVSSEASRASVVLFGSRPITTIRFGDYRTLDNFNILLDRGRLYGGSRRINPALEKASEILEDGRRGVPYIVVLVTSGWQSRSDESIIPVEDAMERLQKLGAQTFVVAIAHEPVNTSAEVLPVASFNELSSRVYGIARNIKVASEPKPANINADIVFLIDSSTTVGRDGFDKEKDFIKEMAKYMKVSPDNSRASVITYSSNVRNVLNFTDHQTEMSFNQKIDREQWTGGTRRIDLALDAAVTSMSQARLNVQKIVILVTGGRQSVGAGDTLERHAQRLNNMGAKLLIVIVGSEANHRDFIPLVHSSDDIFSSSLFSDLRFEVQPIIKHIVKNFEVTPIKDEYIVFLLDSSSPVRPEQFQKEKEFIKSLAKRLYVGIVEKTFATVVNYGSFPLTNIGFDDYSSFQEFERRVDGITPADGTRRIDRALDEAASIFNSTDPSSSKILFLLTTGRQAQESDVTPFDVAIQPLIDMGTHTYVIAVGSAPSVRELRPLVDNPEDLFQLLFNMLQNQVSRIVKHTRTDHPRPIPDHHFVLLMDSSSDVTNQEFSQEILFVKALARELNVSIPNFHAAVISFGNRNSVVVRFGSYRSFRDFYSAVDSSAYQGGARRMDKALDSAHEILSAPRIGSQKTVILITGGRNSENAAPKSLQLSAQKLQNIGANVLFVVFRNRYDVQELLPAVQHPNDIHQIQGANDLLNYVSSLAAYISLDRHVPVQEPKLVTDVIFAIDSSFEVSQIEFKMQKDFIKSLLRSLDMAPDTSRTAVISYGDQASLASRFISLQNFKDFYRVVDSASYVGGERRIDQAFRMVNRLLNEAEEDSSKVVIFFTAGKQTIGGVSLFDITEPMRLSGLKVIVIAIGKDADAKELGALVSIPQDVLTVTSFENLQSQTKQISGYIRNTAAALRADRHVDVVFLVDSSDGVNIMDYNQEKAFVKLMAKRLNISPQKSRAAVVAYGSNSKVEIDLDNDNDVLIFERMVDGMAYLGGSPRVDKAMETAANVLNDSRTSRPKVVVLLTVGQQSSDAPSLAVSAGKLRALGAMVYVVSVTVDIDPKYFEVLVENGTHLSNVPSFDDLGNALPKVIHTIEKGIASREMLTADVVFLMDASTTDTLQNFESQKVLIKLLMKNLGALSENLRASLILYSTSAYVKSELKNYTTSQTFENEVEKTTYLKGARRIDKALTAAVQQMSQSRPLSAKIAVVIVTGPQSQAADTTQLRVAAQPLRDSNAHIFVVGIGKNVKLRELNLITKNPQDVQTILSPTEIILNVHRWSRQLRINANEGIYPALIPSADLVFLLDSSSGVALTVFKEQKNFIKFIVGNFKIGANRTRVAVVRYSSSASTVISFNTFYNLLDLLNGIEDIRSISGGRRLDAAFTEASKLLAGTRSDVPVYVILLTAGRQVVTSGSMPLSIAAQPLLDSKARLIVVGIGSQPNDRELSSMVKRDNDVFRILPSELQLRAPSFLLYMASQVAVKLLPRDFKTDVLFLVDSSQTVSKENFQRELDFVKAVIRPLNISPGKSRASVVSFGHSPSPPSIRFDDSTDIGYLLRSIDSVPYVGGRKQLGKALLFAARVFPMSRPDSRKILVVVTDGEQTLGEDLTEAARPLHELGVILYVIGAGENADMNELGKVTSRHENLFYSKEFDGLARQAPVVYGQIVLIGPISRPRHIFFLVDSSGLRSANEFASQINCIKVVAKRLDVSPNGTRAGVIFYNNPPQLTIALDKYKTVPELYTLLDGLSLQGGGRQLHKALTLAGQTIQASPTSAPKYVVVFVEGQQYVTNGAALLREAVRPLQARGVTVYLVAIGNKINRQELTSMVQNSEHIVHVPDFTQLLQRVGEISNLIDFTISVDCKSALDVGFLVDASGSIGLETFSRNKNFVKLMSKKIADSSPETRLGLMAFSDISTLFVDFVDFEQMTIDDFQTIADELPFYRGRSRIDLALQTSSKDLFPEKRNGVPQVLVLVSDGRQSRDPGYTPLIRAVKPLQDQGVKILAIGFGDRVNRKDLEILTGSVNNIFAAKDNRDIDKLQEEVASKVCKI